MSAKSKQQKKAKATNSQFRPRPEAGCMANAEAATAQRVERSPLDLKPQTKKTIAKDQAERRKKGFRTAAMILLAISVIALARAAVNETLLHNPRFTLQETKVESQGMLTTNQIASACGVAKGTNLLTVNLSDVRERLLLLPAVSGASVRRDFKGTLTLTVQQRKPVAWVKCEPLGWNPKHPMHCLLADGEGVAIPSDVMLSEFNDLPVIDDKTIDQVTPGRSIKSPRFVACMKLLNELQSRGPRDHVKLVSISVPNKFALDAVFDNGSTVTFAYDDLDPQLQRYDRFVAEARQKNWSVQSVNLVAAHNVPVTFRVTKSATPSLPAAIPVAAPQVAVAAPAAHSSTNRAARSGSGKTTRKTSSH